MSDSHKPSPLPAVLRPLGGVFATGYGAAVQWRNQRFDRGLRVTRLPLPVISVGNLSVGGTGKTPIIAAIARHLRARGKSPIIAMRGYRAAPGEQSDEQGEHEFLNPDVPVVAHPNRVAALQEFLGEHPDQYDCVLLDDGFQHRFVHRDLDVILIDSTRSPFGDRLLPSGWLREPVSNLARADVVILTRTDLVDDVTTESLERSIRSVHDAIEVASVRQAWSGIRDGDETHDVSWLNGKRVHVTCAIGNPDAFVEMVERHGATIVSKIIRPDHADYDGHDVQHMVKVLAQQPADAWITTGKDWVKIEPWPEGLDLDLQMVRPVLEMVGDDRYESLLSRMDELVSTGVST